MYTHIGNISTTDVELSLQGIYVTPIALICPY